MTTYALQGFVLDQSGPGDSVVAITDIELRFTVADGTPSVSYTIPDPFFVEFAEVISGHLGIDSSGNGTVDPGEFDLPDNILSPNVDEEVLQITWDDGGTPRTSYVLNWFDNDTLESYVFFLGGDDLTANFADPATANAFLADPGTVIGAPPGGSGFAPGEAIAIPSTDVTFISEDDVVVLEDSDPPSTNVFYEGGIGNDAVIVTSVATNFLTLDYNGLSAAVGFTVNQGTNSASVNKGANGTDTITGINSPLTNDEGVDFTGTQFNDTFDVDVGSGGTTFLQVTGGRGQDGYTVNNGRNHARLQFTYGNDSADLATQGLVADFSTGTISNDGFGNSETITSVNGGYFYSIAGTQLNDSVTGGAGNEQFIMYAGNDTVDGGGGFDRMRYDRNGVSNVDITFDGVTGKWTATGTWSAFGGPATAFTHVFENIERIDGSRNTVGGDTIDGSTGNDEIRGREGDDDIAGDAGNDFLQGDAGNDTLNGGDGDDRLDGGLGDDTLDPGTDSGNFGFDQIFGSDGNDTIVLGNVVSNFVSLNYSPLVGPITANIDVDGNTASVTKPGGLDTISDIQHVSQNADGWEIVGTTAGDSFTVDYNTNVNLAGYIVSGAGTDSYTLLGDFAGQRAGVRLDLGFATDFSLVPQGVSVDLSLGSNQILNDGFGNVENISGNGRFEQIRGSFGADSFQGGALDDTFVARGGNDTADGGAGVDWIQYDPRRVNAVDIDLGAGTASGTVDQTDFGGGAAVAFNATVTNFENAVGSRNGNDTIDGSSGDNVLRGRGGNDTIDGHAGNDNLRGEDGNDSLVGGAGNDSLEGGAGNDTLRPGAGTDFQYLNPGTGSDLIDLAGTGGGFTQIDYSGWSLGTVNFTMALSSNTASAVKGVGGTDTIQNIADPVSANNFGVVGTTGNDTFTVDFQGLDGRVDIRSGQGADTFNLSNGAKVFLELGRDVTYDNLATQAATIDLTLANNQIVNDGFGTSDDINGTFTGTMRLTGFADSATGAGGNEQFEGMDGNDTLTGGDGNDSLFGGNGDDSLSGGAGFDYFQAGQGNDTVDGGTDVNPDDDFDFISYYWDIKNAQDNGDTIAGVGITAVFSDTLDGSAAVSQDGFNTADTLFEIEGLEGTNFADSITTGGLGLFARGLQGNDTIDGTLGDDDFAAYSNTANKGGFQGININFGTSTFIDTFNTNDVLIGIENIWGSDFNDAITGDNVIGRRLVGNGGDDTITGGSLADTLEGGDGNDQLFGLGGADTLKDGSGNDSVDGGAGNDTILGEGGVDTFNGGTGTDTYVDDLLGLGTTPQSFDVFFDLSTGKHGSSLQSPAQYDDIIAIENFTLTGDFDATVTGDGMANAFTTDLGADTLLGAGGNDTLDGGAGNDSLDGGADDDSLLGAAGADTLLGGDGFDSLDGDIGNDNLDGGADGDTLQGGAGADTLIGGTGNDSLDGGTENDSLDGGADNDTLLGGAGADTLIGGAGNDTLDGGADNDSLDGGANDDVLRAGDGLDTYAGGTGTDLLIDDLSGEANPSAYNMIFNMAAGLRGANTEAVIDRDPVSGIENYTLIGSVDGLVIGDGLNNVLVTDLGNDTINGGLGNDSIESGGGADNVDGSNGDDTINGGTGNDTLLGSVGFDLINGQGDADSIDGGSANDTLLGGSGDDTLLGGSENDQLFGGSGADLLDGGEGADVFIIDAFDTVTDTGSSGFDKAIINVGAGLAVDMTGWSGVERVSGFTGNDTVDASSYGEEIFVAGAGGNDVITGGGQNDILFGGSGDDTIDGGAGNDLIIGDAGADVLSGGAGDDSFYLEDALDVVTDAGAGFDKVVISSATGLSLAIGSWANLERAAGGIGNDTIDATGATQDIKLSGGDGTDSLVGGSGADIFLGQNGADVMEGGSGNDSMIGGAGADTFDGGLGNDLFIADPGADVFVFDAGFGRDIVVGYDDTSHLFDFTAHAGVNAFTDLTVAQVGVNTEISVTASPADTIVLASVNSALIDATDFDFV